MRVTNTRATTAAYPMNAAARGVANPGQDFLSAVKAAEAAAAVPAGQSVFRDVYSQAVGVNATQVDETPSYWNDETLSHFIAGKFTGNMNYPIDTTKAINWQSSGDHKLTADEIAQLKEKYDVTHLTAQEYYDLMSDLTHMEVLSGGDVMGVHLATAGSELTFQTWSLFPGSAKQTIEGDYQGNAVNYFAVMLTRLLESWEWLNSKEYKAANSHLSTEKQAMIREATLKDLQPRRKMAEVLSRLQ